MYEPMHPVSVWESDSVSALTDVDGAARFLLTKWPDVADTTLHRVARQAALDALMGATFVDTFRAAFIAAARRRGSSHRVGARRHGSRVVSISRARRLKRG